jgi:chorismate synthase
VGPAAGEETLRIEGRHDPCIVPRVIPVLEAMVAIALLDCLLVQGMYERFRR